MRGSAGLRWTALHKMPTNKNHYRLYCPLTRCLKSGAPTGITVEGAFIMELLLSLLVGCGISLILFYRK
jgi:hypothetical protein